MLFTSETSKKIIMAKGRKRKEWAFERIPVDKSLRIYRLLHIDNENSSEPKWRILEKTLEEYEKLKEQAAQLNNEWGETVFKDYLIRMTGHYPNIDKEKFGIMWGIQYYALRGEPIPETLFKKLRELFNNE